MKLTPLRAISTALLTLSLTIFFFTCKENVKTPPAAANDAITAVPLPSIVPGFKFPEDSTTIYQWLSGPYFDTVSIYKHVWGIWAGLTDNSGQSYKQQKLLVFETWPGINDIVDVVEMGKTDCPQRHGPVELELAHQFAHARFLRKEVVKSGNTVDTINNVGWVSVSYDPTAACFATKNRLLDSSVIASYNKPGGIGTIPAFPNTAITLKPTYVIGKVTDAIIEIPSWPGATASDTVFGPPKWQSSVFIDVKNGQPAGKVIVPTTGPNPTPEQIKAATCNLSDFIYFKVDSLAAAYITQQQGGKQGVSANAGDLAILVAMHVATKEISNWTWQTFFWTADPAKPLFPSNNVAASLRPTQLVGAASHYALSTAYAMVRPNQPITGGTNTGVSPVIGYNPYLEAGLGFIQNIPNALSSNLNYGVQSNCMSCHSLAGVGTAGYSADQYISMNDPKIFNNSVQLDFAWSIQQNLFNPQKVKK